MAIVIKAPVGHEVNLGQLALLVALLTSVVIQILKRRTAADHHFIKRLEKAGLEAGVFVRTSTCPDCRGEAFEQRSESAEYTY